MNNDNIFWLNEPQILFKNYLNFIPSTTMNEIQIYNSLTRLCLYLLILILIFRKSIYYIYICISIIIIIIVMNFIKYKNINYNTKTNENFKNINLTYNTGSFDNIDYQFDLNNNENIIRRNDINQDTSDINEINKDVQVGYYDSDGKIQFYKTTDKQNEDNMPNSADLTFSCRKPTKDNPFMNSDVDDYTNNNPPVSCNDDDENIPENITKSFNEDLYMNFEDIFEKKNSQRQFFSVPNAEVPNKQVEFANWLYKSPETCKENQEKCLRYEDLKYKR
jgi:hypothetical protein